MIQLDYSGVSLNINIINDILTNQNQEKIGNCKQGFNSGRYLKMYSKQLILIIFIFWLTAFQSAIAVNIKTTVDRNPVNINESFQIIFTATESPNGKPDFSPLEREFEILDKSQSTRSSWINGQSSRTIQWVIDVIAKRTGQLRIPAIAFGDDHSQPLVIKVTEIKHSIHQTNDDIFIQVEVTPKQAYVQSQLIYSLRLYRRLQLAQASLTEPTMDNAIIEKLADDDNFNTEINGVSYAVTERKYAIFPQISGLQTISPVILTAEVVTRSRPRFNGFFTRQSTQTRRIKSESMSINVLPAPDSFKDKHWLPATQIHIKDQWSGDIQQMKVGEPLTRTIRLSAKGITSAQLPPLYQPLNQKSIKTYPDRAQLKEQKEARGIIALREEKIAYIAENPGSYTLPAIKIPWFNIQTGQMEVAQIPAVSMVVIPSVTAKPQFTPTHKAINSPLPINNKTPQTVIQVVENKTWMWVALLFALAWLMTLLILIRRSKPIKQQTKTVNNDTPKLNESIKHLKQACLANDNQAAKNALLDWGKIQFQCYNLTDIAEHVDEPLCTEIALLNQTLYSQQPNSWQGDVLLRVFSHYQVKPLKGEDHTLELEPLHKL